MRPGFVTDKGVWCLTNTKPVKEHFAIPADKVQSKHFRAKGDIIYITKALESAHRFNNVPGGTITFSDSQIHKFNSQPTMSKINSLFNITPEALALVTRTNLGLEEKEGGASCSSIYEIYSKVGKGESLTEPETALTLDPLWAGVVLTFQKVELQLWQESTDFPFSDRSAKVVDASVSDTIEAIQMLQSGNPTEVGTDAQLGAETLAEVFGALVNPEAYQTAASVEEIATTVEEIEPTTGPDNPYVEVMEEATVPAEVIENLLVQPSTAPVVMLGEFGLKAAEVETMYNTVNAAIKDTQGTLANLEGVRDSIARTAITTVKNAAAQLDAGTKTTPAIAETVDVEAEVAA